MPLIVLVSTSLPNKSSLSATETFFLKFDTETIICALRLMVSKCRVQLVHLALLSAQIVSFALFLFHFPSSFY